MFSTISGIIVMAVVTALIATVSRHFGEKFKQRMVEAFGCGIFSGLVCMLAPKAPAVISLILMIAVLMLMFVIVLWWNANGSTVKELIILSVADLLIMLAGRSAASRIEALTSIKWVVGFIEALPIIAFILSVGFFVANMIYFKEWLKSEEFDPDYYLSGEEKLSDFDGESFYKKIWRWVSDEDKIYTDNYFGNTSDRCADC